MAGQGIALTLVRWLSEMRVVSGRGGWPKRNPMPARACAGGSQVWEMSHLVPSIQHILRCHFHPAECEQLLSQVFEGRAEVVDGVVDDEETVVVAVTLPNRNGRILSVVAFEVT